MIENNFSIPSAQDLRRIASEAHFQKLQNKDEWRTLINAAMVNNISVIQQAAKEGLYSKTFNTDFWIGRLGHLVNPDLKNHYCNEFRNELHKRFDQSNLSFFNRDNFQYEISWAM